MNVLLVTSRITYMPENYLGLFSRLFALESDRPSPMRFRALVALNNLDSSVVKSTFGLYLLGARRVSRQLASNIWQLKNGAREKLCSRYGVEYLSWDSMNSPEAVNWVKENQIDLIINLRTRCIYKKDILLAPKIGCINIHHGLLPQYRGTLCDLYALTEGRPAGFTIHEMNQKIDAGKILRKIEVSSGDDKDYIEYLKRTGTMEAEALFTLLNKIEEKNELPEGEANVCDNPVFTRNPKREQIKEFIERGFIL